MCYFRRGQFQPNSFQELQFHLVGFGNLLKYSGILIKRFTALQVSVSYL